MEIAFAKTNKPLEYSGMIKLEEFGFKKQDLAWKILMKELKLGLIYASSLQNYASKSLKPMPDLSAPYCSFYIEHLKELLSS